MNEKVLLVRSGAFFTSRLARTAAALREAGVEVRVLGWDRGGDDQQSAFQKQLKAEGYHIDNIWVGRAPFARGIRGIPKRLRYMWAVARYIKRRGPFDVVHAIDLDSALPVAWACSFGWHRGPLVYDIADYIELYYTIPNALAALVARVGKWVMGRADVLLIPDENRRSVIPAALRSKTTVVTNAPDIGDAFVEELREEAARSSSAIDIFYYGSFSGDRGIDLLLQAADRVEDVQFWFAGWGRLAEEVKQADQKYENVHFLGRLSHEDVLRRAAGMDLICIAYDPSYGVNRMASPNKLFEAMAVEKPVVVARNTSIDQTVETHDLGWVIDYQAEALVHLLRTLDKSEVRRRGENAGRLYEQYKWDASKHRMWAVYQSMLKDNLRKRKDKRR